MKNKKILFLILILVTGFASVSTTLVINGVVKIGTNEQEFKIFFSEAILDDEDKSNSIIKDNKKVIDFETNELTLVNQVSMLDYEVTNNSRQYDARVEINCAAKSPEVLDYVELSYEIDKEIIHAKEKVRGRIKAKLIKAYTGEEEFDKELTCTIGATALEKGEANDIVLENHEYYTYGYLLQDGLPIEKSLVALISPNEEIKYTTTDARGMFIVENLDGGDYEILVFDNKTQSDVEGLAREELEALATDSTRFKTKDEKIVLTNYEIAYSKINAGSPTKHTVIFDTGEGLTENITSAIIEGEPIGYLPDMIVHDTLAFINWEVEGNVVNTDSVYNNDITLNANYGEGVARIGTKQFTTLNKAFNYVDSYDETTIEVIKNNAIPRSIVTDKNIILDLNEKTVQFNEYDITTSGNLTIENGNIKASGLNAIINDGTLNLTNNLNFEHINNIDETGVDSIINNENATLNISGISAYTSYPSATSIPSFVVNRGKTEIAESDIELVNSNIYSSANSTLIFNNNNISGKFTNFSSRIISIAGELIINGGTYKMLEGNETSSGILQLSLTGTLTINSGTFDNTYGTSSLIYTNTETTLNIGKEDKDIFFIGNGATYYTINSQGNLNIKDGTINAENGYFVGSFGTITLGTEDVTPTINGAEGFGVFGILSSSDNKIKNASINASDGYAIYSRLASKLTIDNVSIVQSNSSSVRRALQVSGELIVNDGTIKMSEDNTSGYGLFDISSTGILTINSGTFDNLYGKANAIYSYADSTLNMGKKENDINLIGKGHSHYTIAVYGSFNIPAGTINVENGVFLYNEGLLSVGTEKTTPTINIETGFNVFEISSANDNKIINANINAQDERAINIHENSKLTIDNVNIVQLNSSSANRALQVSGELIVNDGTFEISEDNTTSKGLVELNSTGTLTINSGTFNNAYGTENAVYANSGSTLNIGKKDNELRFIGNGTSNYIISSSGNLNIPDGTINVENGHFIGNFGTMIFGTEETTSTINGAEGFIISEIRSSNDNKIKNATINASEINAINSYAESKLTIDNLTLSYMSKKSTNRAINVSGEVTINGGTYRTTEENETSYGLFNVNSTGTLTINSGTFDNTYGKGNSISAASSSNLNIGEQGKTTNIIGNNTSSYTISTAGNINILAGTINASKGHFINSNEKMIIGTEETIPTINGAEGYKTLIYRGGKDHRIINANINGLNNYTIDVQDESAKLTIDNINITQSNSTSTSHMINVTGALNINDGAYKISEENVKSKGLVNVNSTGTLTINSVTFDNTYGKDNAILTKASSTLNIGDKDKKIKFIGNGTGKNTISSEGNANILDGEITAENGVLLNSKGLLTVGTEETTPTITGAVGSHVLIAASSAENKIVNANIYNKDAYAVEVSSGGKMMIDNIYVEQKNVTSAIRAMSVFGNLTVNNGIFKLSDENKTGYGLFNIHANGVLNIISGTFDGTNSKSSSLQVYTNGRLNIIGEEQEINVIGNRMNYSLANSGYLNVSSGDIVFENGSSISNSGTLTVGTEEKTPTITGAEGFDVFEISSSNDNRIINANITSRDGYAISSYAESKLTIDYLTLSHIGKNFKYRSINVSGELIVNDGIYKMSEENTTGYGLLEVKSTGILTINSGTFDNTYGKSNALVTAGSSTLNIGKKDNEIRFIGDGTANYIIASGGNLNMLDGTINSENGPFIGNYGTMILGTEETTPTITGAEEFGMFGIISSNDNRIINANISSRDCYAISSYAESKLTIDNLTLSYMGKKSSNRAINVSGELIINDGTYKMSEENATSFGLFNINSTGTLTMNSGTIDNTYGKSNAIYTNTGSTLNIGKKDNTIRFIGDGTDDYTIASLGNINILDGTINAENGPFIGNHGTIIIGTEDTKPKITGTSVFVLFEIESAKDNKIINADINISNGIIVGVNPNGKISIDNGVFTSDFQIIADSGELNINGGTFTGTGKIGNFIGVYSSGVLNIGAEEKNPINITNMVAEEHPPIANTGILNIYSGTIKCNGSNAIIQRSDSETGEAEEENNTAEINIYGGYIENNISDAPTISMLYGTLNMSGGEVVNKADGLTISNEGGTAIQTGGISLRNYGVTVQ